jgi:hypothetical protein
MANTFELIGSTVTVGSGGAASISFTSIPATFTDLKVVMSARSDKSTGNAADVVVQFNSTATTYTHITVYGDGASAASNTPVYIGSISQSTNTASTFGSLDFYLPNYTSSNQKSYSTDAVQENNVSSPVYAFLSAGLWNGTAAINTIAFSLVSGNFVQYSTAYLYGVKSS